MQQPQNDEWQNVPYRNRKANRPVKNEQRSPRTQINTQNPGGNQRRNQRSENNQTIPNQDDIQGYGTDKLSRPNVGNNNGQQYF